MTQRSLFRTASAALFLSLCAAAPAAFTRKPYLQNLQKTSVVVMWESDSTGQAVVRYGPDAGMAMSAMSIEVRLDHASSPKGLLDWGVSGPPKSAHVFEACLTGLTPGQAYCYVVEQGSDCSSLERFRAAPEGGAKVRFVAYGDNRSHPQVHASVAKQIAAANPDLLLNTGDLVETGQLYAVWTKEFFQPLEGILGHIPVWPTIGNHEGDGVFYRALFSLPEGRRSSSPQLGKLNYSFDYGPAHFASIDSLITPVEETARWLDRDLAASKAPWKLVFTHHPTYNAGGHHTRWGRGEISPILEKYGVDVAFSGHSHLYERSAPIRSGYAPDAKPVVYIVTGGGGADLYAAGEEEYTVKSVSTYHIVTVDVDGAKLTAKAVDENGRTLDSFSLDKAQPKGQRFAGPVIERRSSSPWLASELALFSEELRTDLERKHGLLPEMGSVDSSSARPKRHRVKPFPAGIPTVLSFHLENHKVREPVTVVLRPEPDEWLQSVTPASMKLTIGPREEKIVEFTVVANTDMTVENMGKKLKNRPAAGLHGAKPYIPLRFKADYHASLGKGGFTTAGVFFSHNASGKADR